MPIASKHSQAAFTPAYLKLLESGELAERVRHAHQHMEDCDLCGRACHVNRTQTMEGVACRSGNEVRVASFGLDFGGEDPIRGVCGAGTISFSWCNMRCVYCDNSEISNCGEGTSKSVRELADMMLDLQIQGAHNINLVSPSHAVAQILGAVQMAAEDGLRLPLVYNTGGYDSPEALKLLNGVIDIYLSDMKYGSSDIARKYSKIRDYVMVNRVAVKEMHAQVGDLVIDGDGVARRGLLVRHLILPGDLGDTDTVLKFVAENISPATYVNLMTQYRPGFQTGDYPELDHRPSIGDFREAQEAALRLGLTRLDDRLPEWMGEGA
ncbi:MAG: radical SAM protein [Alphaproteobacteria bacterium]